MLRAVLYGEQDLRIENCEIPIINSNEVLIKNKISTTCGTDVKIYYRGYPLLKPPHPFGHEFSGIIVDTGKDIKNFKIGDRVAVHNSAPCNNCYFCKNGQHSLCTNLLFNRGTYAEYVKVPQQIVEQNMFKLEENISFKLASLLEPLSCALYGIDQTPINQGDTIVINGVGPIGLMFVKLAYLKGAKIIATDISKYRLNIAGKLGAHVCIDLSDSSDPVNNIISHTNNGIGADIVIESSGQISVWENSILMARKGGFILLFGGTKKDTIFSVDANLMHYSQLTIKGVFHTVPKCVDKAFKMLNMGIIDENDFIQNEYRLTNLESAILEHKKGNVIKNCIVY